MSVNFAEVVKLLENASALYLSMLFKVINTEAVTPLCELNADAHLFNWMVA